MIYRSLTRVNNNTIIPQSQIKSFHYHIQSNQDGNLRLGNVISSYIEVELFTQNGNLPDIGEVISYSRGYDNDSFLQNSVPFPPQYYHRGYFIVFDKNISSNGDICTIVAYDETKKLDKNYSKRLLELKSNGQFPMLVSDLLEDAITYAGLRLNSIEQGDTFYGLQVNAFYSDNITCRDIVSSITELKGFYSFVTASNTISVNGQYSLTRLSPYYNNSSYIVCPTDQIEYLDDNDNVLIPAYYKQNGLIISNYEVQAIDDVFIYNANGTLLGKSNNNANPQNVYYITDNLIVNNCIIDEPQTTISWNTIASNMLGLLNNILPYRPISVEMFPFRCPYEKVCMAQIVDTDGNRYTIPVMNIDEYDHGVTIGSFGQNETQSFINEFNTTEKKTTSLDARVNEQENNKVSKSGDTMTGTLAFDLPDKDGAVKIQPVSQGSGTHQGLMIQGATGLIFGSGEAPTNAYNADLNSIQTTASEDLILLSDGKIVGYVNCNTIANAIKAFEILATGEVNLNLPLSISSGGTGQNGVSSTSTISDILTVGTNVTVSAAQFATFGKIAQLRIVFTRSSAVASGNTTIATLTSGKTPVFNALATCHTNHDLVAYVNANGNVVVNGPISANTSYTVYSTYILA